MDGLYDQFSLLTHLAIFLGFPLLMSAWGMAFWVVPYSIMCAVMWHIHKQIQSGELDREHFDDEANQWLGIAVSFLMTATLAITLWTLHALCFAPPGAYRWTPDVDEIIRVPPVTTTVAALESHLTTLATPTWVPLAPSDTSVPGIFNRDDWDRGFEERALAAEQALDLAVGLNPPRTPAPAAKRQRNWIPAWLSTARFSEAWSSLWRTAASDAVPTAAKTVLASGAAGGPSKAQETDESGVRYCTYCGQKHAGSVLRHARKHDGRYPVYRLT